MLFLLIVAVWVLFASDLDEDVKMWIGFFCFLMVMLVFMGPIG